MNKEVSQEPKECEECGSDERLFCEECFPNYLLVNGSSDVIEKLDEEVYQFIRKEVGGKKEECETLCEKINNASIKVDGIDAFWALYAELSSKLQEYHRLEFLMKLLRWRKEHEEDFMFFDKSLNCLESQCGRMKNDCDT